MDLRVLALALTMERRQNGGDISHLRSDPVMRATKVTQHEAEKDSSSNKLPGFYNPGDTEEDDEETESGDEAEHNHSKEVSEHRPLMGGL